MTSNNMASIFLFLLLVTWTWSCCVGDQAMEEMKAPKKDADEECAKKLEKKYSRFNHEFLAERCKNHRVWKDKSMKGSFKPKRQSTSKQLEYLHSLSACKEPGCQPEEEGPNAASSAPSASKESSAPSEASSVAPKYSSNTDQQKAAGSEATSEDVVAKRTTKRSTVSRCPGKSTVASSATPSTKPSSKPTSAPSTKSSATPTTKPSVSSSTRQETTPSKTTSKVTVTTQALSTTPTATPSTKPPTSNLKCVRKDLRVFSDDERNRLFSALQTLKTQLIDGVSKYDIFVTYHTPDQSPLAHNDPAFLPWHREYLNILEIALRQVDPTVCLPCWDSTLDYNLPTRSDSILWTEAFLGNDQGEVTSGPFSNWTTVEYQDLSENLSPNMKIVREVGQTTWGEPIQNDDVQNILDAPDYQSLVSCDSDAFLEMVHDLVHVFVGGHMMYIPIAPNDPIFFMHHAFIDQIWEMWRQTKQTPTQRENDFYVPPPENNCQGSSATIDDQLNPFDPKIVKDGLSNVYTDKFYTYQDRASCSNSCHNSPYLFCDQAKSVCMSKIRPNGNCRGYEGQDICYNGSCSRGVCVPNRGK